MNSDKWLLAVGLITLLVMVLWVFKVDNASPMTDIVSIAQSQIGRGETSGNNRGPDVKKYLSGKEGLPWCAGFVSYCAKTSGSKIRYTLRAKDFLRLGKKIKEPMAGDLIVFSRSGGSGHVGIIETVSLTKIITIEGNTGNYPSKVKRFSYNKNHVKNLLVYIRIK